MSVLGELVGKGVVYADGWQVPHGGGYDARDVATGEVLGSVGVADADDMDAAGRRAREAQPGWASLPFTERARLLGEAAIFLEGVERDDRVMMQREEGAIATKIDGELRKAADELRAAAALLRHPYGDLLPSDDPSELSFARRVAAGVVGVIAPWNAPLLLAMRAVAPALALGNAVIVKPDPKTAISGGLVLAKAFEAAGLPSGVLQVLAGGPDAGEALVASPYTDVISFTGSTGAGRRVGEVAGGLLKKVVLELGGNNAFIVLEDADLDEAVRYALTGSLLHNGQICMATGRHLVHESVADAYTERLRAAVAAMKVGDPTDPDTRIGPLISMQQIERVQEVVDAAVAAGAKTLIGGRHDGPFFPPTVLTDVTPDNPAFAREIFGPVLPITRFRDEDEAVALANDTDYGLAAAIHSTDLNRALALSARLRTGMVHINGMTIGDTPWAPMGGMGQSGNGGRYGGHWNLDEFTSWQWVTARSVASR